MRRADRRCTDTLPARRERRKLEKSCGETECERTVEHDEVAFDVMNGAQATFSRTRLPDGPVPLKATSWQDALRAQGRQEWCEKNEGTA
jgi:hypothetical protein